jgi:serine/threonine protein phosphatase PrpC
MYTAEDLNPALLKRKGVLFLVADGLGKGGIGRMASDLAVRTVVNEYYSDPSPDIHQSLVQAIEKANGAILSEIARNPAYAGMGTTLVAGVLQGSDLFVASVGDSRAYLVRAKNIFQITQDHTWVADQVRAGSLTPEEAETHPNRRHLSRSLGAHAELSIDQAHHKIQPEDRLLLCSDGLSDMVTDEEIRQVITQQKAQVAVQQLVALANQRGGADNITAVAIGVPKGLALATIPVVPIAAGAAVVLLVLLVSLLGRSPSPSSATPTPFTSTATATPEGGFVVSATPSHTPLPQVTATPSSTATVAPTSTPGRVSPTPKPSGTPIPRAAYQAPTLSGPENGAAFSGPDAVIVLSWGKVGDLANDEYYVVTIPYPHDGGTWHEVQWSKKPELQVPEYLYSLLSEPRECQWYVTVMRQTGTDAGGNKTGVALSDRSEVRTFVWNLESEPVRPEPEESPVEPTPTFEKP